MRLVNVNTYRLEEFHYRIPRYAILSHTWSDKELLFDEIQAPSYTLKTSTHIKLARCIDQAQKNGLEYVWIDTCCINKSNSDELQTAINSMYRYYADAAICYVYLADVPDGDNVRDPKSSFLSSRWFRRGWTLQELLAPSDVRFYNDKWSYLGTKQELCREIEMTTGIPRPFLLGAVALREASVAQRMSWAARRTTTRPEDTAYCLLGIFGLHMPLLYGEGHVRAFARLQMEILKTGRDESILAWGLGAREDSMGPVPARLFALAPSDFINCAEVTLGKLSDIIIEQGRVLVHLVLHTTQDGITYGLLNCRLKDIDYVLGIPLEKKAGSQRPINEFFRSTRRSVVILPKPPPDAVPVRFYIDIYYSPTQPFHIVIDDVITNLVLVDVYPPASSQMSNSEIRGTLNLENDVTHQTLARFRTRDEESPYVLIVFEVGMMLSPDLIKCHLMVCSGDTDLEDLSQKLGFMRREAFGKQSASSGGLNFRVVIQPWGTSYPTKAFGVSLIQMISPTEVTVDANAELRWLEHDVRDNLRQEDKDSMEAGRLDKDKVPEDDVGLTPLSLAARNGHMAVVKLLLDNGANLSATSSGGRVPLSWAVLNGHATVVEVLLERTAEPEPAIDGGWTLLSWAAWEGHESVAKRLLERGADPERKDDIKGRPPLSWAALAGSKTIVDLLLQHGANVDSRDAAYGRTPLSWAAGSGKAAVVTSLLLRGADIESKDEKYGQTPLSWAARTGQDASVAILLGYGADRQAKDDRYGATPLSWAALCGHKRIVRLLQDNPEV